MLVLLVDSFMLQCFWFILCQVKLVSSKLLNFSAVLGNSFKSSRVKWLIFFFFFSRALQYLLNTGLFSKLTLKTIVMICTQDIIFQLNSLAYLILKKKCLHKNQIDIAVWPWLAQLHWLIFVCHLIPPLCSDISKLTCFFSFKLSMGRSADFGILCLCTTLLTQIFTFVVLNCMVSCHYLDNRAIVSKINS